MFSNRFSQFLSSLEGHLIAESSQKSLAPTHQVLSLLLLLLLLLLLSILLLLRQCL